MHCFAVVAEESAGLANLDRLVKTSPRRADEHLGLVVYFADRIGRIKIGVVSL